MTSAQKIMVTATAIWMAVCGASALISSHSPPIVVQPPKSVSQVHRSDPTPAPERVRWLVNEQGIGKFDQALATAKRLHRNVFIDFAPTWCRVCQDARKTLYGVQRITDKLESEYVPLCIGDGDTAMRYGVHQHAPWVVIVDPDGKQVASYQPFLDPDSFLKQLDQYER